MVRLGFLVALGAACSSGAGGGAPHGEHPAPARVDAAVAPPAAPLTVRECDDLIAHAVALAGAARGSGSAAPTAAELESVAASLRADLGAACSALPRAQYGCAIAAPTLADLRACER